jgi:hypothetical protein
MEIAELKNKIMFDLLSRNKENMVFLSPKLCYCLDYPDKIIVECQQVEITQRNNGRPRTKFFTYNISGNYISEEMLSKDEINSLIDL